MDTGRMQEAGVDPRKERAEGDASMETNNASLGRFEVGRREERNQSGPWNRVRGGQAEDRSLGHIASYGLRLAQLRPPNDEECEVDDSNRASFVSFGPFHGTGMRAIRCPPRKACTLHACSSSRDDRRQSCGLVFMMTLLKRSNA